MDASEFHRKFEKHHRRAIVRPLSPSSQIPYPHSLPLFRWTLLTACFSHEDTGHILLNGMSFFFMAPPVLALLGNMRFLALYLGGGLVSSTVSLVWNALQGRPSQSHGASGSSSRSLFPLSRLVDAEL
jgi:membrane associated rhomboid family serine protease